MKVTDEMIEWVWNRTNGVSRKKVDLILGRAEQYAAISASPAGEGVETKTERTELRSAANVGGLLRSLEEAADNTSGHRRDYFLDAVYVIEKMQGALKPFAKEAEEYNGWVSKAIPFVGDDEDGFYEANYTVGDLRRARDLASPTALTKEATHD